MSEAFDLTTYYAKRIIGDTAAASESSALLQTGSGVTGDTWILHRDNRDTNSKLYGIKYAYDSTNGHDKIEYYGKGTSDNAAAWIQLDTGDASFNNILGKINITGTSLPSSGNKSYYLTYVDNSSTGHQDVKTSGRLYVYETTDTSYFSVGASGSKGGLTLWSGTGHADIIPTTLTANTTRTLKLPNVSGWIAVGGDGSSTGVGDIDTPIYLKTDGTLAAITSYDGNAASATKLQNTRSLWGNNFDGTANIGGTLTPDGNRTRNIGSATAMWNDAHIRGAAIRHIDAAATDYTTDSALYIGYGSVAPTKATYIYYSADTSSRTKFFEVNNNGAYAPTRFGVNGQNTSYNLYVNGTEYITSAITSSYKCTTYLNSLTSSVITLTDTDGSFGGWICGPTKNGRIAIASYQNNDDKLYFGYGERGRTTNSYAKTMTWDGSTNTLTATTFSGSLSGNATSATNLTTPRVTKSCNEHPGKNYTRMQEFSSTSANLPSAHFYYIFESQGDDPAYSTQLALGETISALYYRAIQNNTYGDWNRIVTNSGSWSISVTGSSGSCTGNAATATRLATFNLTGGNGNTGGFRLAYTWSIGAWSNHRMSFIVQSRHSGGGLVTISVGNNTSTVSRENMYAEIKYWGPTSSGDIIAAARWQIYGSADGTKAYLFWNYGDYNTGTIIPLTDTAPSNGTWMETIDSSYGTLLASTEINAATSAVYLKDRTNSTVSYLNYGAAGLAASAITWLCCWNGYEVRAISKAEMANAVDSAHKWVRIGGDSMTGALNFANNTWNTVGDDVRIGDRNVAGTLCIQSSGTSMTAIRIMKAGDEASYSTIRYDGWLRLGDANGGTYSGVYFGSSLVRTDGTLRAGTGSGSWTDITAGAVVARIDSGESRLEARNGTHRVYLYCNSDGRSGIYGTRTDGTAHSLIAFANNSSTGTFYGNCTGSSGSCTGNAATASALTAISSSDAASSSATWRYAWFSYDNNSTGRPAYATTYAYQSNTGTLKVGRISCWPSLGTNSYNEGIRIHASSGNWTTLMLCASDNTGDTGTSTKSWGFFNNDGTLYINKNTSSGDTHARAYSAGEGWYFWKVYGAVWNDYAECRIAETTEPGYCVTETASGKMIKTTKRLQSGCKLTSDTYGTLIGETEEAKTPIAVAGRVLVYPYRNPIHYQLGAAVCSAPNGTVDIMSREEIMMYPERIVGTVSEIPTYDIWKTGNGDTNVKVNGRIWIYVR